MTGAPPAPSAQADQTFAPAPTSARAARRWLSPLLDDWTVGSRAGDVLLVVSELVTNAVMHGDGPVHLRLARADPGLRVEVSDDGGGAPTPRSLDPEAPGGRGLLVVAHLAEAWGVTDRSPLGKTVWVELALP